MEQWRNWQTLGETYDSFTIGLNYTVTEELKKSALRKPSIPESRPRLSLPGIP